jgi:hypothetical protein
MKKLSESDKELLLARGKVKCLTTVRDFEIPSTNSPNSKGGVVTGKPYEKKKHPLVGKILHTSWGYDMTMNDFCKILEVSPTGKTVKCRMLTTRTNGLEHAIGGSGKASAGDNLVGPIFRLKVKEYNDFTSFNGCYPFCGAENIPLNAKKSEYSNRMGYFSVCKETDTFYENHVD